MGVRRLTGLFLCVACAAPSAASAALPVIFFARRSTSITWLSVRPETIVALVQESGALDRARNLANEYAARAKACLNGHGDSEYARALRTLPDFILEREN